MATTDIKLHHPGFLDRPAGTSLSNWREGPYNLWSFHHVQDVVPCATVKAANRPTALPAGESADLGSVSLSSGEQLEALLSSAYSDSMVVLHRGKKVWEWSAPHCDISRPHIVFSVSKSITAMMTGVATGLGLIDIDKPVSHYLPGTKNSGYGDASVQHVLDMSVALAFTEEYLNPDGDYYRYRNASGWNPIDQTAKFETLEPFFYSLGRADHPHGEVFSYKSPNSDLLGLLLERVTGIYYADLLSQMLWQPMGAVHDGCVTVDPAFLARGAGGVCVHIDDLARFGQLVLDDGVANGRQVIPSAWIHDTLHNGSRSAWQKGDFSDMLPDGCYRNKWYQLRDPDRCFMALGIHGQWLYINPRTEVVIAKLSSQPEPVDEKLDMKLLGVFAELTRMW